MLLFLLFQIDSMELGYLPLGTSIGNGTIPSEFLTEPATISKSSLQKDLGNLDRIFPHKNISSNHTKGYESDVESEKGEVPQVVVGKKRRSQPVQLQSTPRNRPLKMKAPRSQPPKIKVSDTNKAVKKRGTRCGECPGCLRDDCGMCIFCNDKPKFGGPGKKKQRCKLRACSNFLKRKVNFLYCT